MNNNNKPIFNYVLGIYGHFFYDRDLGARPDVINTTNKNKSVHRISNIFYYRTKALAKYIKTLNEIDPTSIIYITSDHLPPIICGNVQYTKDKYTNISLFFDSTEQIDVSGKNYYEIPWFIWDILTGKKNDRTFKESTMEELYYKALSESL